MRVAASIPMLVFAVVIVAKIPLWTLMTRETSGQVQPFQRIPEVPAKLAQAFDGAHSVRLPQRNIFRAIP